MSGAAYEPRQVMPQPLARALTDDTFWFVIGGQAVRCFAPYRPSRDTDLGVDRLATLDDLLRHLEARGAVEVLERSAGTVHLTWDGIKVSLFVLDKLVPFVEGRRLSLTGLLATKLHAILDRGLRRDFFDLYVLLQRERLGIAECLAAMRAVYGAQVHDGLLLRALAFFEDAERQAPLPGEGPEDWSTVKGFFLERVGSLIVPPGRELAIQKRIVDVTPTQA